MSKFSMETETLGRVDIGRNVKWSDTLIEIELGELNGGGFVNVSMSRKEVLRFIQGMLVVSEIPFKDLEEHLNVKTYQYRLPRALRTSSTESYLNFSTVTNRAFISNKVPTEEIQTEFTEERFHELVKFYPELYIMDKEEIEVEI